MKINPTKVNSFLFFKLPLGWISGMRVKEINNKKCIVSIKYRWINQNPFKSMFWAAQGMAAELTTGLLVMNEINEAQKKISMLVTHQEGSFFKKAVGRILFTCNDGELVESAIQNIIQNSTTEVIRLHSKGINEEGVEVANFTFTWSLKLKSE